MSFHVKCWVFVLYFGKAWGKVMGPLGVSQQLDLVKGSLVIYHGLYLLQVLAFLYP